MKVYLDYSATSPVKNEVKKALLPFLENNFGNPSSIHSWGQVARTAVEKARTQVAEFLNSKPEEIIFTSGGTEADNLAVRGISNWSAKGKFQISNSKPHIITSAIEHYAILRTCEYLEKNNLAEITYLKPNKEGLITKEQVKKAVKKNTVLASVIYVNNEIGVIQPIREIGKMIEKENEKRENKIYFHTDAVQAAEYLPMNVDFLHVDLLTISGHKIGAPKGIGALYFRKDVPLRKIIFGGEQEMNLRAGTENVAGIVALGKATEVLRDKKYEIRAEKTLKLRDYFIDRVLKEISEVELNGSRQSRSPNNANFYFKYVEGESILLSLDLVGIAASSGSACTSLSLKPSHVLMATYNNAERSHGSIRFTLGEKTTKEEIDYTITNLKTIIKRLREISPLGVK
ncbi:MAG: cysteine desulfurase [Patescibacteria group bacterium]|nr:cysteine desulfurase [Patescibacteria group bacterium]